MGFLSCMIPMFSSIRVVAALHLVTTDRSFYSPQHGAEQPLDALPSFRNQQGLQSLGTHCNYFLLLAPLTWWSSAWITRR